MKRSTTAIILAGLILLTGLAVVALPLSRPAPGDAQALTAANALVAAGHIAEAAQMYEQLIGLGARDAAVYYNLGSAALMLGDADRAVAAYEQAAALAPRDADIQANLALARQQASGQVNVQPLGGLAGVASRWLTVNELALLALGAWFALGLLVLIYRALQPGHRPVVLRVAVVAGLFVVLMLGSALVSRLATPQLAAPPALAPQQAAVLTVGSRPV